ncbi:MAG TPA: hypothetical protein VJK71_06545 [Gemmatimonadales bacterium]|nr:hypothetical protein [Gemmatimonadales bacterium]
MLQARLRTTEQMEVFDERGVPLGRVTRPTDPRLFGPEKGTVYLQRTVSRTMPQELPPAA